jgi:uncharacterized protein YdiU (UPF0061 family)
VARFAESWLRVGSFDLPRQRADRKLIRKVATYLAEDVFGGWEMLPGKLPASGLGDRVIPPYPQRGLPPSAIEGSGLEEENRFVRLYREIARRNAKTVAAWQAYGFMNGVLNTDNTSLLGLSMDFGPFGFMDNFDRHYSPNHDDFTQRYSYRNQPAVIWWNLVRLGEALAELLGAGAAVDDSKFTDHLDGDMNKSLKDDIIHRAEAVIERVGLEYRGIYLSDYEGLMRKRLGWNELEDHRGSDQQLVSDLLDMMESLEIDFNRFFRKLGELSVTAPRDDDARRAEAASFLHQEGVTVPGVSQKIAESRISGWLDRWRHRLLEGYDAQQGTAGHEELDERRRQSMNSVNPKVLSSHVFLFVLGATFLVFGSNCSEVALFYRSYSPLNSCPIALTLTHTRARVHHIHTYSSFHVRGSLMKSLIASSASMTATLYLASYTWHCIPLTRCGTSMALKRHRRTPLLTRTLLPLRWTATS